MISLVLGLFAGLYGQIASPISVQTLLREMSDRSTFARLPSVPYRQLQASSYDRTQTDPKDAKTWFGNKDYEQFIRTETHQGKTEWVVMEHTGPGAITRIWTPLLGDKDKMLVRFYFDGSDKPGIEEPFNDLMRGKSIFQSPFAFISWPDKGVESGVGSDLYYPIPYAHGCKVTFSELPFYYSISYRAYAEGTTVETFSRSQVAENLSLASETARTLNSPVNHLEPDRTVHIAPGNSVKIPVPKGANAIDGIELDCSTPLDLQALRSTIIQMTFDGERTVWCPIGEFFGCGVHSRPVWDRYRRVDENGMCCRWTMPYQRSSDVRLINLGAAPISFEVKVSTHMWKWDDRSLYFHADWRGQYPLATRPFSDWNYVSAKGEGIYVGDTLTVFSPSSAWYGEGDERVYVDGEAFPSHLGTGTEDYYGYAWGMAEHFSSAYVAMPEKDLKGRDNWMGYTTTSRIRGLDAVPFRKSLQFDMEIWHWADCQVGYSAASFWYGRPGAKSNRDPMPKEASAPLPESNSTIKGAIECETMKVLSKSDGVQISTQSGALTQGTWSNNTQLFLQCTKPGDAVELYVPVQKSGKHRVLLYATKSFDYGIIRFSIDGHIAKDIDLWSLKPVASGPIDLGEFDISKDGFALKSEVVGTNPKSTGQHYYLGLDCVVLKTVKGL